MPEFTPFGKQINILESTKRNIGVFCGKRAGKTEIGAIKSIMLQEQKPNWVDKGIDPYIGMIIAPTTDMLRRLSLKKFMAYAKPFIKNFNRSTFEIEWHDGSLIYGLSSDRPQRIEGIKANYCWADEVLQMNEQTFLEIRARISDSEGYIISTGSLGVNITNPKNHWAYRYYKETPDEDTECYEWTTSDNPYFPKAELSKLKENLDPRTFRQMFAIDWNVVGSSTVYDEFSEDNLISNYIYNPSLETHCSIDWGFAHDMAVLYFQYDRAKNTVYLFDEIVTNRLTLEKLWAKMQSRNYRINTYVCDIAGDQSREQMGFSNMHWFKQKGIHFKARRTAIVYGIPIVRSFIKDGKGRVGFYIDEKRCPKTIDQIKNYSYPEKNGTILNENPVKKDDDAVDALRYYFVNVHDNRIKQVATVGYY